MQVLVSYSYFEKNEGQRENFEFFIMAGMGIRATGVSLPAATDFSVVVSGELCTPCSALRAGITAMDVPIAGIASAYGSPRLIILHRQGNLGMDFAAHNVRLGCLMNSKNGGSATHGYQRYQFDATDSHTCRQPCST